MNIKIFLNDLSDKRHLDRLFTKYNTDKYNFIEIREVIINRAQHCEDPNTMSTYYKDLRFLMYVQHTWDEHTRERHKLCEEIRKKLVSL